MVIRTVLDARPSKSRSYLVPTLLLAHSWAALSGRSALEVVVVGKAPSRVVARLSELGAEVTFSQPHVLDPLARSVNKLLGMASAAAPVLLVDNDVCLLKDIFGLEGRKVRACVDGTNRISQAQWEQIAITTGLRPLEVDWVPLSEDIKAKWAGHVPKPLQRLYLNGGVVWVREPAVFASTWAAHLEGIAKVFEAHPLRTHYVIGSDQVALSTAAAEHGGFDLLPLAYNCRPRCIRLGVTDPTILHLTRLSKAWAGSFSKTLAAYWDRRVILRIRRESERMPGRCAAREREQLLDEAVGLRDRVMRLGAEAGLDDFQL